MNRFVLYSELTWDSYRPHADGVELFQRIVDQGKLQDFENLLVEVSEAGYVDEIEVDDMLRFEEDYLIDVLGLDMTEDEEVDEGEEDGEGLTPEEYHWLYSKTRDVAADMKAKGEALRDPADEKTCWLQFYEKLTEEERHNYANVLTMEYLAGMMLRRWVEENDV